ncbi:MAG: translation initiation factor IF-2, partial [Isosphaeraceae bacterium]
PPGPTAATPAPSATTPRAAPGTPTAPTPPPAPPAAAAFHGAPKPGTSQGPTGPSSAGTTSGPLSRHGGLRSGSGPLSGHTPHRGPASGSSAPRSTPPAGQADFRPNPSTPPPLKRTDYISPTGTRPPLGRSGAPLGGQSPPRRPADEGGSGENTRRDASTAAPRRPLPPVASLAPPRTGGPAGGGPSAPRREGPEAKTQRPEVKYTPEQLRAMMRSGQLGNQAPGAAPTRQGPGGRPSGPAGPGLAGGPRGPIGPGGPAGPPGAPGLRRPLGGPAAPTAAPAPPMSEDDDDRKGKPGNRLGSPADRAGRRARRNERATERRVTSPQPAAALLNEDDDGRRGRSGGRKHGKGGHRAAVATFRKTSAQVEPPVTIRSLSEAIGVRANELIKKLMTNFGQLVNINATLEDESAQMLALEYGIELEIVHERTAEDEMLEAFEPGESDPRDLEPRPPVITILGHVDHGKTSLLDKIRKANVVATESGGITQHIGAYQIEHEGKLITFVDTPGHEAFTAMRARGANVTDIVVLVVAADDGVMPQTQEAIDHAKAAEVPIVVALNKIDLPNVDTSSNVNKIYGELAQRGLNPEEWGGDTPVVKTSTLTGQGLGDLLATLDAIAELNELKATPKRAATGTCLEASISEGRGVMATVLVQDGTLRVGDSVVCGDGFGRVRALFDDQGRSVNEAGPSRPVELSGLDEVPTAGEKFAVVEDVARAREIAEARRTRSRGVNLGERQSVTLENLFSQMAAQKVKTLNLILKADVQGSLEALAKELEKLENDEVPIRILLKGVGGISESDILLADATQAVVIGFRVAPEDRAISLADEKKIEIRRYDIIYQVTNEIKKAIEGMLVPEIKEVQLGRAVVRQVFKLSKVGAVAGCFVTQGTIERSAKARLIREGREIYKGGIEALKRFKDDVREVREGFECGIKITNYDDMKIDDVIEAYRIDEIRRTL